MDEGWDEGWKSREIWMEDGIKVQGKFANVTLVSDDYESVIR